MSKIALETYEHRSGQPFKALPEVYQVEMTNFCNLKCPMCLRTTDMVRQKGFLDLKLLELMHWRGDFDGSYFTELQMAGEPTLHKELLDAVRFLKEEVGVLVGLSTHGLLMHERRVLDALVQLDALTISVDSTDPEKYAKMRYPARLDDLLERLQTLHNRLESRASLGVPIPLVELQLIDTPMVEGSGDHVALEEMVKARGWRHYTVRTTADSFIEMQGRGTGVPNMDVCLNPFGSVSVNYNGDVVSCCYVFDPDKTSVNYYGNLYDQSLAEIWNGVRVKKMQETQLSRKQTDQCAKCYLRSPLQIHQNIAARLIRHSRRK